MMITRLYSTMAAIGFPARQKSKLLLILLGPLLWSGCANSIVYQPSRRMALGPDQRGIDFEEVKFESEDGVHLTGWWMPASKPKGTVVHFHGNAQNMSTHVQYAEWLPAAGYNLFVFDYRGYGKSHGSPDRVGLIRDGMAALETAYNQPGVKDLPFYVWAQSLGGTVGMQSMMRSDIPINAAIIDSTFSSYGKIASDKMKAFPWFLQPLRLFRPLLISSSYNAQDALPHLQDTPILFMHGNQDPVIPYSHSQNLQKMSPDSSVLWIIPGAAHCDAVLRFPDKVRPNMIKFLESPETYINSDL